MLRKSKIAFIGPLIENADEDREEGASASEDKCEGKGEGEGAGEGIVTCEVMLLALVIQRSRDSTCWAA